MLPFEEFKKTLGELKGELSEEEMLELWEKEDKMAELFINSWLEEVKKT